MLIEVPIFFFWFYFIKPNFCFVSARKRAEKFNKNGNLGTDTDLEGLGMTACLFSIYI